MKRYHVFKSVFAILVFISLWPIATSAKSTHTLSHSQVLALVADYKKDPVSEVGFSAARKILSFAEQSKDVLVEVNGNTTPWLTHTKISEPIKGILLGAYVVGNVEPQILMGQRKANHCSGAAEVQRVLKLIILPNSIAQISLADMLNKRSMAKHNCTAKSPVEIKSA